MSLAEKLDKIRAGGAKRIAPERRAIMLAATKTLRESGIADNAPKVGDMLPTFSLDDAQGNKINSPDLLAHGPLVVTVFRGVW